MTIVVNKTDVNLPEQISNKISGMKIEFVEINDGFIMKSFGSSIKKAKGCLMGTGFSSEVYLKMKNEEKENEQ